MPRLPFSAATLLQTLRSPVRSVSLAALLSQPETDNKMNPPAAEELTYKIQPYRPANPEGSFPYGKADLTPMDSSPDTAFYSQPRFVTHIDDHAIIALKQYYDTCLPSATVGQTSPSDGVSRPLRILDLCSSWISHYPPRIAQAAMAITLPSSKNAAQDQKTLDSLSPVTTAGQASPISCYGTGLNARELGANPALNPTASGRARDGEPIAEKRWWVQDLNSEPVLAPPEGLLGSVDADTRTSVHFDATTCVVSIDYLTDPVAVLSSVLDHTVPGGTVHLAISNRCFPTKAVSRWLQISEQQRLEMVGDYLWWSGWRELEIVEVVGQNPGRWGLSSWHDPLWVVRARKVTLGS